MEFKEVLKLFTQACIKNEWGYMAYIVLYGDGSGEVCSEDNDVLFEFGNMEQLIKKLRE